VEHGQPHADFEPGGKFEHLKTPNELARQAYWLTCACSARRSRTSCKSAPECRASCPPEAMLERLQAKGLAEFPDGAPILDYCKHPSPQISDSIGDEEERAAELARKAFAQDKAISDREQAPRSSLTAAVADKLGPGPRSPQPRLDIKAWSRARVVPVSRAVRRTRG
jgi:hypothetical protein